MSRFLIMTMGVIAISIFSPLSSWSELQETSPATAVSSSNANGRDSRSPAALEIPPHPPLEKGGGGDFHADQQEPPRSQIYLQEDGLHVDSKDLHLKMKFGGRIQYDVGTVDADAAAESAFPDLDARGNMFRRVRPYVSGTLHDRLHFKAEVEFTSSGSFEPQLMDSYIRLREIPLFGEIQAGHMKEPFSLEELLSNSDTTFMELSLPIDAFAPAYNLGVMSRRTFVDQSMTLALGGFWNTGPLTFDDFRQTIEEADVFHLTTRVTALPWYADQGGRLLHLGVSYSHAFQDDDETKYSTLPESYLVNEKLVSTGNFFTDATDRLNPELAIVVGPFSVQSEFSYALGQATPDVHFWGYYLYGSFFLTGESRPYDRDRAIFSQLKPLHAFRPWCGEWGAWELGLRYSYVDLNSGDIQGGKEKNITFGLNGYLSTNLRLIFNYVHARVEDLAEPGGDHGTLNIFQGRFQVVF
jgi:phosphate-selective porin OprO and OprP